jgi:acyl-CoA thioesterase II
LRSTVKLMGDFERDTRVEGSGGRYAIALSPDWNVWGPNGGYLAAIALRAVGAEAAVRRPATFAAHYLSVARFAPVDVEVVALRRGKRSESFRVSIRQDSKPILEALVWTAAERDGLAHDVATPPVVPDPAELKSSDELWAGRTRPRYAFWDNIEQRPTHFDPREPPEPANPEHIAWYRFRPRATFDDPFVDAARSLLLIDTMVWPAAWRKHVPEDYYAPNLDVVAWFHRIVPDSEWLLCEAHAPIGHGGLIGGTARVYSRDGRLIASGGEQLACTSTAAFNRS